MNPTGQAELGKIRGHRSHSLKEAAGSVMTEREFERSFIRPHGHYVNHINDNVIQQSHVKVTQD